MKKIFSFFIYMLCAFTGMSQSTIGDVKYSILEPAVFMNLNPGWVLMDGNASKESDSLFKLSSLHLDFKFSRLPDARGVFIRGMNLGRNRSCGNPDGDTTIASYQKDTLGAHSHKIAIALTKEGDGTRDLNQVRGGQINDRPFPGIAVTESVGMDETRPRNIVLYTYIKIN